MIKRRSNYDREQSNRENQVPDAYGGTGSREKRNGRFGSSNQGTGRCTAVPSNRHAGRVSGDGGEADSKATENYGKRNDLSIVPEML